MTANRPVVAVVFGGRSSEHAISCLSAGSVLAAIDRNVFEVVAVGIARDGRMYLQQGSPDLLAVNGNSLPEVNTTGQRVMLSTDPTTPGFIGPEGQEVPANCRRIDAVFSVLHGPYGEDGTLQGILEFAGIPCVGSGVFASAAAMDKAHMKAMFQSAGLLVGPYEVVTDRQWRNDPDACIERVSGLGFPVFVKPARAGSSIGITKVASAATLETAILAAREHDPKVIVEAALAGVREIECGVLAAADGTPAASVPAEIIVHGHDFYDFEAKYLEDSAELCVPADLPSETVTEVQAAALAAFSAVDCEGFARCDFFLAPDGTLYFNEVNTLPGFTSISMFPRMWQASGMSYPELVERLIRDALRRGAGLR